MTTTRRSAAAAGLALYTGAAALVVLVPDRGAMLGVLRSMQSAALDLGLGWAVAGRIEFVLNVLLVAPIPVLGAIVIRRSSFLLWVVGVGIGGSAVVEMTQLAFLPGRTASVADVVANGLGALIGWGAARLVHRPEGAVVDLRREPEPATHRSSDE